MVNKQLHKVSGELKEGPPPMDESWWEAVLAEEKQGVQGSPPPTRNTAKYKNSTIHNQNDTVAVDWKIATELFEQDKASSLQVDGYNRGGLLVSGEGLQGFVPISHLTAMPEDDTEVGQEQFLESYSGKQLQLKIIECDQERSRVVFSERAALTEEGKRNQLLRQLKSSQCVDGTVTNITDFGIFVDLGGVEGLIHVSEISWGRVRHPSDVVDYGEKVKVHVINVDPNRSRVALSIKRLHPNPWATAHSRYQSGQVTEATIISIVPFGAFARLEEGLDGLIHVSEMSQAEEPVDPKELLSVGQQVQVQILHVDAANQRLGLSLVFNQ
jgi:small subunit ribosomal protein S1